MYRNKIVKDAIVVDCRNPRDMGAIEIALCTRCHRVTECIFEPILGMVFDSKEEAYDFYNMYSWELAFGIIYNTRKCSGSADNKYISMQEITCKKGVCFRNLIYGFTNLKLHTEADFDNDNAGS
jgi:hypothetical protein